MGRRPARLQVKAILRLSAAVAVVTIAVKTLAWWLTGSVGLLSDAMESLVNLASALFAYVMVTIAEKPADDDHPFGHTKAEYFSSGFEGLLVAGTAAAILVAAGMRFSHPAAIEALGVGLTLTVASSLLNWALAWRMMAASLEHRSIVLEADARHLYTDVWTSAGIVIGLLLVRATGWLWLDPLLAVTVALNILREGIHLVWRSVNGLMDTAVEPEVQRQIDAILQRFDEPVIRFDHAVTRRAGQRRFIDVHMHVPASWTLGRAAALRGDVEQALTTEVPGLSASIQLLSTDAEAHSHRDAAEEAVAVRL